MAAKPEQIGNSRKIVNGDWHRIKKQTSRYRRRQAKRDLENAPKHRGCYVGWAA